MKNTIGSSIICMDHLNFDHHVRLADRLGVDYLHLDVMDGRFVPRYGIYPEIVRCISEKTSLKMDLHLMVSDPEFALTQFTGIKNIEFISVHLDGDQKNLLRVFDKIKHEGSKPVLVVDIGTDIYHVAQYVRNKFIDGLMFMGIHPGVLSQTARPETVVHKLAELGELCDLEGLFIQCDGGVTFETIPHLRNSGINNFVCGSSTLYKNCDFRSDAEISDQKIQSNFQRIRELVNG